MADTLKTVYSELMFQQPLWPQELAKRAIQRRFKEAQMKAQWACQQGQGSFSIPDVVTGGTLSVTNGSTSVVGVGTSFTGSAGKQIWFGGRAPYYTILSSPTPTALTLSLDRPFNEASLVGSASYEIGQVYLVAPSDFLAWVSVVDIVNQAPLQLNVPKSAVDMRDPTRISVGTPRMLVQASYSTSGVPRYEVWERVTAQRTLDFSYIKEYPFTTDTDTVPLPFQTSMLIEGGLADLCRWPGTVNQRNIYFSLDAATVHEKRFQSLLNESMVRDQEIYQTDVMGDASFGSLGYNAEWLRTHDWQPL